MKAGFSVYAGSDWAVTEASIAHASEQGIANAFISLQIPEERVGRCQNRLCDLLRCCRSLGIGLMADVSPATPALLGVSSIEALSDLGISCIRLDYGFSDREVVRLSSSFRISFNASTTSMRHVDRWVAQGVDVSRFIACHNFYPKPFSGLSIDAVCRANRQIKDRGIETAAFIPGDGALRGPLYEGLPTVEGHRARRREVIRNAVELYGSGGCDVVYVGDPDLTDAGWSSMGELNRGIAPIHVELYEACEILYGTVHQDRADASPYLFRSVDSRTDEWLAPQLTELAGRLRPDGAERLPGDVVLSLSSFGRYAGELEIVRTRLPADERTRVIGRVAESDVAVLRLLPAGMCIRFARR